MIRHHRHYGLGLLLVDIDRYRGRQAQLSSELSGAADPDPAGAQSTRALHFFLIPYVMMIQE